MTVQLNDKIILREIVGPKNANISKPVFAEWFFGCLAYAHCQLLLHYQGIIDL